MFVKIGGLVRRVRHAGQDCGVDVEIAFAATCGDDHVHVRENIAVAFDASGVERKTGGIGADALPVFHLALVALFRDLGVEIHRRQGMYDVWSIGHGVGGGLRRHQFLPMGLGAFAKIGHDADAGDPGFAFRVSH